MEDMVDLMHLIRKWKKVIAHYNTRSSKSNGRSCVFILGNMKLIQMINKNRSGSSSSANLNANAASCEVLR
ncbi:hypothetical protein HAX54_048507, partial [Datura stramonium]|nr:hypothetical protein [Datura stramonium]